MSRTARTLIAALAALLACGVLPAGAQANVDITTTRLFRNILPAVQDTTGVPIRIPRRVTLMVDRGQTLYSSGSGSASRYSFDIAYARNCGGATACLGARFTGRRGNRLAGGREVSLAKGLKGRFFPTRCGASCSKPQVQWFQNGVTYTIQLAVPEPERTALVRLANAAIRAPRL